MSENNSQSLGDLFPDLGPEVPIISGVAHDNTESLATVRRVPNERAWPPRCSRCWLRPA